MKCKKCEMLLSFELRNPNTPLIAVCSNCKHEQQVQFEEIPDYGDFMTMEEFVDCCESGGFIDYDGFGNLGTATQMSSIEISPSKILKDPMFKHPGVLAVYTHVIWFNR